MSRRDDRRGRPNQSPVPLPYHHPGSVPPPGKTSSRGTRTPSHSNGPPSSERKRGAGSRSYSRNSRLLSNKEDDYDDEPSVGRGGGPPKKLTLLDDIPWNYIDAARPVLVNNFRICAAVTLVLQLVTLSATIAYIILWWDAGYTFWLWVRLLNFVRVLLIAKTICVRDLDVVTIRGVGRYYKIVRHFSRHPSLGLWMLTGMLDLYLFRLTIPAFDLLKFTLFGPVDTLQFPSYLLLDALYVLDYYGGFYLVYKLGVWVNVTANVVKPYSRGGEGEERGGRGGRGRGRNNETLMV